jgi:hypothetical protein
MWDVFAGASRDALRTLKDVPGDHPVWSDRPYKVFLYTPGDVRDRVDYGRCNPLRERLPEQHWHFVTPYDG